MSNMRDNQNAVCFDLDETLGSFSQLYKFWHLLKNNIKDEDLSEKYFFSIIDLFPQFLRPNIFKILKNLKKKKQKQLCNYVMIYTNNNGPNYWANLIKSYFHHKLKFNLFDYIIRAFKIDGKKIEMCRTSHGKSYSDFINCTQLPPNTQILFLDDQYHKDMNHENVLYINLKPYNYNIDYESMCEKFYYKNNNLFNTKKIKRPLDHFIKFIRHNTHYDKFPYLTKTSIEKNIELLITENIIKELNIFFNIPEKNTKKNRKKREKKNKTQKL